jgi:lipoate-protein ligase A
MDVRLIYHPPASGAWNMAVDEALLEMTCQTGQTGWLAFLLLGAADFVVGVLPATYRPATTLAEPLCPLIRRSTGGGAIIHAEELTYSLCMPLASHLDPRSQELYQAVHETFIDELASRGIPARICGETTGTPVDKEPFLCFLRRSDFDILLGGHKVVGSAQRRRRLGLLQHGSVLLRNTREAPELAGIEDISGFCMDLWELARRWSQRIAARLQLRLDPVELDDDIVQLARQWSAKRFAREDWVCRR